MAEESQAPLFAVAKALWWMHTHTYEIPFSVDSAHVELILCCTTPLHANMFHVLQLF